MQISVRAAEPSEEGTMRRLFELYAHDWSEFDHADVDGCGAYGSPYLALYWTEPGRFPFFIQLPEQLVGFVLVNRHCIVRKAQDAHSIAEFFVMRKYRRQGVGRMAAEIIFDQFPGNWEVVQHRCNLPSVQFWESVIDRYTEGDFTQHPVAIRDWDGQALLFNNA